MIRQIIHIDQAACNGCGLCAKACHESAIAMVNGKATLIRDDYCDGMGDCLPACPTGAISFEMREAAAYDEAAVAANQRAKAAQATGCPGSRARQLTGSATSGNEGPGPASRLRTWPVQIKLAPIRAAHFDGADLLIAADCTAYAFGDFHRRFMEGRVTLIGCPKLDAVDYSEKLAELLRCNDIRSVTVVRMEVPCCGGMANAVQRAVAACGKALPLRTVILSLDGQVLRDE